MSYIGNQSENKVSPAYMRETLSPDGSATYFDLIHDVPGYQAENLLVTVNNVIQEPANAYTIINDANNRPRRLNFGVALATTDSLYVIHRGAGELYHTPPSNSVGTSALQDNLRSGNVDSFTATAGQTAFTLSEIPYSAQAINVYVNGIYQKPITNYTVTGSSTALTLSSGILLNDEVDVHHNTLRTTVSHVADASVTTSKLADGAVSDAKLSTGTTEADSFNLPGQHVKIPSVTTTQRDALTAAVGMIIYNTTIGVLQQYNVVGWQSIDSPPTITSFTYPDSTTALDPAGSTTATLVITGSNFSVGATVLIDGTAPTATTRNSITQITITGYPAKAAATYSAGLKVTNASGLAASVDIAYDAIPAWTTASGSLGTFVDGAFTNSSTSTIRIVAAEGSDTIDYAQVSDAGGATIITSGVAGLTLGTTGANAGYLTGTLAGTDSTTYNFYAKAQDDENQFSAVRLFNIITKDYAATGGVITTYSGFRVHTFLIGNTGEYFTPASALNVDYLVVGGGGGGMGVASNTPGGGGGGGGAFRTAASLAVTAQAYTITVGAGGVSGGDQTSAIGTSGGSSIFHSITALGGGHGASYNYGDGGTGGSGGGASLGRGAGAGGTYGNAGGDQSTQQAGGGGGGAGGVGASTTTATGGAGGAGEDQVMGLSAADSYTLLTNASVGHVVSGARYFAGGGGGGGGYNSSSAAGGAGGSGGGGQAGAASGSVTGNDGTAGTANTGGGGGAGGGGTASVNSQGGAGGSGIVIIRYAV